MENPIQLTHRFIETVDYARHVHVELRKGTQVPYMAHLLGVASLVLGESGHVPFQEFSKIRAEATFSTRMATWNRERHERCKRCSRLISLKRGISGIFISIGNS
jgi:hypothetical protein